MKTNVKKYAGVVLAGTVVIGGIATAAITPIPTISNTFAVAGQIVKSADINKLAEALNILDARTNGSQDFDFGTKKGINLAAPVANADATTKQYVDSAVAAAGGGGLTSGATVSLGSSILNNYLDFSLRTSADCTAGTEAFVEVKTGSGKGYCIEKTERTAAQWEDAALACVNAGKRLPEPFEWKNACQNAATLGLSTMTDNWEWASNFTLPMYSGSINGVGAAIFGGGGCHFATWHWVGYYTGSENTPLSFRCVR